MDCVYNCKKQWTGSGWRSSAYPNHRTDHDYARWELDRLYRRIILRPEQQLWRYLQAVILFHDEVRGAATDPFYIDPLYEPTGKVGTLLLHRTFTILEAGLLLASGLVMIQHAGKPASTQYYGPSGKEYAIYANTFGVVYSAANEAGLPAVGLPVSNKEFMDGVNIMGHSHHYANLPATFQKQLPAGSHRFELWASSGTDATGLAVDEQVGQVKAFGGMTLQLNLLVLSLGS